MQQETRAQLIDGKATASALRARLAQTITELKQDTGETPGLAVVLVGEDPASQVYVRNKGKQTLEVGMNSFEHKLDEDTPQADLLSLIEKLNADESVHGILVQLPLPDHIDSNEIINAISPDKDVDGFHVINSGRLSTGQASLVPCTPVGCVMLAREALGDLKGLHAVVIGRSNIVGKPVAQLLLGEDCTVTIAHSRTKNIEDICKTADLLVAAVGRPQMVKGDWIKKGACIIDVGINRVPSEKTPGKSRLVGDVDFDEAQKVAGSITPVPGGVGPMTIACLLYNTVRAFCAQKGIKTPEL